MGGGKAGIAERDSKANLKLECLEPGCAGVKITSLTVMKTHWGNKHCTCRRAPDPETGCCECFPREKIKGAAFDGLPLSFQLLHLSVLPPGFQPLVQKRASTNAHSRHQASKANQSVEMGQIGIHSGSFNTMPGCMSSGEES